MAFELFKEILYSCDFRTYVVMYSLPCSRLKKTKFKMPVAKKCSRLQEQKTNGT